MKLDIRRFFLFASLFIVSIYLSAYSAALYRVNTIFEDTVRVVILYNTPVGLGSCDPATKPVGLKTRDFIISAIDTTRMRNVKVLPTATTQWSQILALWPGKLPHVIVHSNAGWYDVSGPYLETIFNNAVANKIGVVSVGDDASYLAGNTFGFTGQINMPLPMYDGMQYPDSLWISLDRANDERLKIFQDNSGTLKYPGLNGIISNTVDRVLAGKTQLNFNKLGPGRCEADADRYTVNRPSWNTYLGYQKGLKVSTPNIIDGVNNEYQVLVAIQDTAFVNEGDLLVPRIRRGVALSFEPQFMREVNAAEQIVYDAIIFSSLTHTLSPPTELELSIKDTTMTAGDTISLNAILRDLEKNLVTNTSEYQKITWDFLQTNQNPGVILTNNIGKTVRFTAKEAPDTVKIQATYTGTSGGSSYTRFAVATIYIEVGQAHHLVIEGSANARSASPYADNPVGGNRTVSYIGSETQKKVYAVLRDRMGNFVGMATNATWQVISTPQIVDAISGNASIGEGLINKRGPQGTNQVRGTSGSLSDVITVNVAPTEYDSLRIRVFIPGTGFITINNLTAPTLDDTTLYVEGLRRDRLGPAGSGGWEAVPASWQLSNSAIRVAPTPPTGQSQWGPFIPQDTGRGNITVSLQGTPSKSIPFIFTPGAPAYIALYPQSGMSLAGSYPRAPTVAIDTITAGVPFNKLHVRVFDGNNVYLPEYSTNPTKAQEIAWTINTTVAANLGAITGSSNTLTSTRAWRAIDITVRLQGLSYSASFWVKSGPARALFIERSATITGTSYTEPNIFDPIIIGANETHKNAYAILRDAYNNFVNYSTNTVWSTENPAICSTSVTLVEVGEGDVIRKANSGTTKVIARNTINGLTDTVNATLDTIGYLEFQIYILENGIKIIDTIRIRTDEMQTLYVRGRRSDNNQWDENVSGNWSKSTTLKVTTEPVNPLDRWVVIPDSVGTGFIKVTNPSNPSVKDSIVAIFLPGKANTLGLYPNPGDPFTQQAFTANKTDTIAAGSTKEIYAKVFDRNNQWLSNYENLNVSRTLISWRIEKVEGPGGSDTLNIRSGHVTSFRPTIAYTKYNIIAEFREGTTAISAQFPIYVTFGPAHHLVIEESPQIRNFIDDDPYDPISFGTRDTIKNVYAILRDAFGNFTGYSKNTQWSSQNTAIVTAVEWNARDFGEGRLQRRGDLGQTKIIATNRINTVLTDTTNVNILPPTTDALRIINKDSVVIQSLSIRSDQIETLGVQGKRSYDGAWVPVNGNWRYIANKGSQNNSNSSYWNFAPGDTGTGIIIVTYADAIPDTITVKILPGLPNRLTLYRKEGSVPSANNPEMPSPLTLVTATAGKVDTLVAKLFDHKGVWLPEYENDIQKSRLIAWRIEENPGHTGSASVVFRNAADSLGHLIKYFPIKAWDTTSIIARFNTSTGRTLLDTIRLDIKSGKPYRLVIEPSPNWRSSPNASSPIDTLKIPDSTITGSVYAIIRDSLHNYVQYSTVTTWGKIDTTIAVRAGNPAIGHGIAERKVKQGITKMFAVDSSGLRDSCFVQMLAYYYKQLRIVIGNNTNVSQLTMNTNQDTTLRVEGLRSDTTVWEPVDGSWASPNLSISPQAPEQASSWRFSPSSPGTGNIIVSLKNAPKTIPDTLAVNFTVGPPTRIEFSVQSPVVAGIPFDGIVRIFNLDGPVPGTYCFNDTTGRVIYQDSLGTKGRVGQQTVVVDGVSSPLNTKPDSTSKVIQCFTNGIDTIKATLIYAPVANDSLNKLFVKAGNLRASTELIDVQPGQLARIVIERPDGTAYNDTIRKEYGQSGDTYVSKGYDSFGNKRPDNQLSNWSTTGSLRPIENGNNVFQIYYDAQTNDSAESGYIKAVATGTGATIIADSVYLYIKGSYSQITNAYTRDLDGDGRLDHVELHYNRVVTINNLQGLKINAPGVELNNPQILNAGKSDSIWLISFDEVADNKNQYNTGWTLKITYSRDTTNRIEEEKDEPIKDGAGPVIISVVKTISDPSNSRADRVVITFSEPITKLNDPYFADNAFQVWDKGTTPIDTMFDKISEVSPASASSIQFSMSNSNILEYFHWVNIKEQTPSLITDKSGNPPPSNNQKVQVYVINKDAPIKVFPNPGKPLNLFDHDASQRKNLSASSDEVAYNLVKNGKIGGVIIQAPFTPPPKNTRISCAVKIYDMAGNLVSSDSKDSINASVENQKEKTSQPNAYIYWSGWNSKGMKVAPGVYRVVVYIDYSPRIPGREAKVKVANIGILKD